MFTIIKSMEDDFWLIKNISDFSDEEWESLCDGCGKCCYRKYISGHGKKTRLYYTKVACDYLDLRTNRCTVYNTRFCDCKECEKLTKENIASCTWLPDTCAYRLVYEGKDLPFWHPLISKNNTSTKDYGICIKDGIHEKNCDDWQNFVLYSEKYKE